LFTKNNSKLIYTYHIIHKHFLQILSNLIIYPLIQTTLPSTHNPQIHSNSLSQIHFLNQTNLNRWHMQHIA